MHGVAFDADGIVPAFRLQQAPVRLNRVNLPETYELEHLMA